MICAWNSFQPRLEASMPKKAKEEMCLGIIFSGMYACYVLDF